MQSNRFNVVTDGQFGSTGKGAIAAYLAHRYRPEILSTTNSANAGHTAVNIDGAKFIAKALPSPAILSKWYEDYKPQIIVGATASFDLYQLQKEILETGCYDQLMIHPRAGVITDRHRELEAELATGPKHIASTMQGCGTFLSDKILRKPELKLARDYYELEKHMLHDDSLAFHMYLYRSLMERTILHEGSQGFSLDINHGQSYPQCTSRGTTAVQNLADMGLPISMLGDVYLVIRPYPIRVGNVVEDEKIVGHSGGCYSDQKEITWDQVAQEAGAPSSIAAGELTTVTKRLRRVFTYSKQQIQEAAMVNGATKIALNFANYIDWSCYGINDYSKLTDKVRAFIDKVENDAQIPVGLVGTGPQINHVCSL